MVNQTYLDTFIAAARSVAAHNLVLCGSGNLSWRIDDGHMLVTVTNSWMRRMCADQVTVCRIADGASIDGKKPSKEIGFHAAILRERPDVNVVLHFQSPYATTVACMEPHIEDFFVIPEIAYYIGPVSVVPYHLPGSRELAEATTAAMREHNLAILQNHGQVTVGKDFDEVIGNAAYFELACKIIVDGGDNIRHLSEEAAAELRRLRQTG